MGMPGSAETNGALDGAVSPFNDIEAKATLFKKLADCLPSTINLITTIYSRASNAIAGDMVPQIVFSETSIRLAKLLTAINLSKGVLNDSCLSHLLLGTTLKPPGDLSLSRVSIHPSRKEISNLLDIAIPAPLEDTGLSTTDAAMILGGTASIFASLGMQRKKAMVMKELLSALLPGLNQAKMRGAAEAGIHPSASLAAIEYADFDPNSDSERGLESFLNTLCQIYGIPEFQWSRSVGSSLVQENGLNGTDSGSTQNLPTGLLGGFVLRSFGNIQVKMDVLRACIELCEALPDYHGILHYSTTLLRTAGPGVAPSAETTDVLVNLPREEQVQLANKISRTVIDARNAGYHDVEAEYWDEFLVRGLYVMEAAGPLKLLPHKPADLKVVDTKSQVRNPFIHNPFLEPAKVQMWSNLLAAGDNREFVVSLQNPFDFSVEIEYLKLATGGEDLGISKTDFTLKPYRTQSFSLMGRVLSGGSTTVIGCIIKVQGCKERLFPIFSDAWTPSEDVKIKDIGALRKHDSTRLSDGSTASYLDESVAKFPKSAHISLTAIPEQPILVVSGSSVAEEALMLLEGERISLSVTITNTSTTIPADFIHISVYDSVSSDLQRALGQKGILPADMFEMEYQLLKIPGISLEDNQPKSIAPGASETFRFSILAKPGLTFANFQFDYACLQAPHLEDDETFFTRQVIYPLSITVNASIQIQRLEIIPFAEESFKTPWPATSEDAPFSIATEPPSDQTPVKMTTESERCLLLIDLRNAWPSPLNCSLYIRPPPSTLSSTTIATSTCTVSLKPGQVIRQALPIPKIYLPHPHTRIPSLSPSRRSRQFVISTDRISPDAERSIRETFWFREALLSMLSGSWTAAADVDDNADDRLPGAKKNRTAGSIDFRTIRVHPRMVDVLRLPDLSVALSLLGDAVSPILTNAFSVPVDGFVTLRASLRNRSARTIYPVLRLRPSLADQPRDIGLDIGKRLAWSGVLQRAVRRLKPGEETSVEMPICALCAGEFEVSASVEEARPAVVEEDGRKDKGEVKDDDLDDLVEQVERRVWIDGTSCRIVAREMEE
jgi:trafficking protein particle complex subunit 9